MQKLNDQAEYLQAFTSKYRKMELRLDSHEKIGAEMEENTRYVRAASACAIGLRFDFPQDREAPS